MPPAATNQATPAMEHGSAPNPASSNAQGNASGATPLASQATSAAPPTTSAKIEVPTGTHIPLVLHNAISTRSARPGDPIYLETLFR